MQSGQNLIQAFAMGAGFTLLLFLVLAIYFHVGVRIRRWLATFKMKSLFWRDRRQRQTGRKTQ